MNKKLQKKIGLTLAVTLMALGIGAQTPTNIQGVITYEEVIKMEINMDSLPMDIRGLFPSEAKTEMLLHFNEHTSLYEPSAAVEEEESSELEGEGGIVIRMGVSSEDKCFKDLVRNQMVQQVDFMDRTFLIEEEIEKREWKMTGGQQMIAGYPCMEATCLVDGNPLTAWFAPSIPIASGPDAYGGLPGMILAVSMNNGERTITAKSVVMKEIEKGKLTKPTKGKKLSSKEYDEMVLRKTEEMGGESGDGNVRIVIKTVTE